MGVVEIAMDDGAAEGFAGLAGTLAVTLGCVAMLAYLGLAASDTTNKLYAKLFGGVLALAIFLVRNTATKNFGLATFVKRNMRKKRVLRTCKLGEGGSYALATLALFFGNYEMA